MIRRIVLTAPRPQQALSIVAMCLLFLPFFVQAAPPLTFVSGEISQRGSDIKVSFSTVYEENISHFSFLHSDDGGETYDQVAEMPSVGDKDNPTGYSIFISQKDFLRPFRSGWNHIMVRAHDFDGTYYDLYHGSLYFNDPDTPVFPGDVNSDGYVNTWDFVALCTVLGESGPARPNASTASTLQAAEEWDAFFANGVNLKHADCDGNGIVEFADSLVIKANYDAHILGPLGEVAANIPLRLDFPDSAAAGDTIQLDIWLGEAQQRVEGIYGFSMSFHCDTNNLNLSYARFQLDSSWLGEPGLDLLALAESDMPFEGNCDIAVSRTDGTVRSGAGKVASVSIVMVDDIAKDELERLVGPRISVGLVVDHQLKSVNWAPVDCDSLGAYLVPVSGKEPPLFEAGEIRAYPQPFGNFLLVKGDFDAVPLQSKQLQLYNNQGILVRQMTFSANSIELETEDLAPGVYVLRIDTPNRSFRKTLLHR